MIPVRGALWAVGAIFGAALLWWAYSAYSDAQDAKLAVWKAKAEAAELATDSARLLVAQRDTLYLEGERVYLRGRDVLLNPGPGKPPATAEVRACFALGDSSRLLCQQRHEADTAALSAVTRELNLWKAKPEPRLKRIQPYGELVYDFAHMVPVGRLGVTVRVLGPINLSAAGEYAAPPAGQNSPAFRVMAGLRYVF